LMCEPPFRSPRLWPNTSCEPASRYRLASLPTTVQLCSNHTNGGTERIAIRGMTTISAHPKGDLPVRGNKDLECLFPAEY
jgi:hypothetical protein